MSEEIKNATLVPLRILKLHKYKAVMLADEKGKLRGYASKDGKLVLYHNQVKVKPNPAINVYEDAAEAFAKENKGYTTRADKALKLIKYKYKLDPKLALVIGKIEKTIIRK